MKGLGHVSLSSHHLCPCWVSGNNTRRQCNCHKSKSDVGSKVCGREIALLQILRGENESSKGGKITPQFCQQDWKDSDIYSPSAEQGHDSRPCSHASASCGSSTTSSSRSVQAFEVCCIQCHSSFH